MCTNRSPRPLPCRCGTPRSFSRSRSGLRAFRNLDGLQAVESQNIDGRAQRGLGDVDRNGAMQIAFVALENGVFLDFEDHVQIAGRAAVSAGLAFIRQAQLGAVVDAGRNVDFQLRSRAQIAFALAFLARPANDLAASAALRTGAAHERKACW